MEIVKPLSALADADRRSAMLEMRNRETGAVRPISVADHYARFTAFQLNAEVPEAIRDAFNTAINLHVYSWFVFSFGLVGDMHCLATLEMALRVRAEVPDGTRSPSLSNLLRRAVAEKWIIDEGLPAPPLARLHKELGSGGVAPATDPQAYVKHLVVALPRWRNIMAHGSNMLMPPNAWQLRLTSALINQMWPESPVAT